MENDKNQQSDRQRSLDNVRQNSLKAAGYAYLVGDAALISAGILGKRNKEIASGLLYSVDGLALVYFGNPNAEKRLQMLCKDLSKYLKSQGVEIPKGCVDSKELARDGGIIDHIEEFLFTYPSEVVNVCFALGGAQYLHSGLQHDNRWSAATGALVAAGALAGLLIPEKHPATQEKKETSMLGKVKAWVQEKPLRITGSLYMASDLTMIKSAFDERKKSPNNNTYALKLLTAASYIVANGLLTMSSKNNMSHKNSQGRDQALERIEQIAASTIAAQKPEVQEKLIEQVSGFLSARPGVDMPAEKLATAMREKISSLTVGSTSWKNTAKTPSIEGPART